MDGFLHIEYQLGHAIELHLQCSLVSLGYE